MGILKSFSLNSRVMHELPEFNVTVVEIGRRGIAQKRHYKSEPFIVIYNTLVHQERGVPVNIRIKSEKEYSIDIDGVKTEKEVYSFGERFTEAGFDFIIGLRNSLDYKFSPDFNNKFTFWFNNPEGLANVYRGKLQIAPLKEDASLVTLTTSGPVPLQEAEYLNKLMEVYGQQGLDYKNETAKKTIDFIDNQLMIISDSLNQAETNLENFRLSNKLVDLSSEGTAIKGKIEKYTSEKITADLQKRYFNYLAAYVRTRNESGEIMSPTIMGVTDPLLIKLVDELGSLQLQKKQLSYNFSDDQPAVIYINSKIEETRQALNENLNSNILNVQSILDDIERRLSLVEEDLSRLPGTERRLIDIQRTFDLNNTVYTYMLEKRSEAEIAKASNVSGNRVIDKAEPFNSAMISPQATRNYLIAIILGFLLPGLYIFLADRFHNKIVDKKDIERGTSVPIAGFIGHNSTNGGLPVIAKPGSSLSESFRTIRTNLKFYQKVEGKSIFSVTSTISGEGKTFVSLNLAAVLSLLGKRTLLVGMDLRKPKLDRIFNSSGNIGLSTYLIGESAYEDIFITTDINNMYFVPSGPVPPNPTELIESEKMKLFIEKAKQQFDYIIMDTPPVGIVSDALLLGNYADVNLFIIRQGFSFKSTLEYIQNIFLKKELKNLTIVVNDIHISGYYGYGLRYGYGFYEGYGYNYGYAQYGTYGRSYNHKYYTEN
jgi:capsular exopolysaccharide synthesis family protein